MDCTTWEYIKPCIIVAFIYHPQLVFSPDVLNHQPYMSTLTNPAKPVTFDVTTSSRRCCGRGWKAKIVWKKTHVALDFGWRHPVSDSNCSSSKREQMLLIREFLCTGFASIMRICCVFSVWLCERWYDVLSAMAERMCANALFMIYTYCVCTHVSQFSHLWIICMYIYAIVWHELSSLATMFTMLRLYASKY